MNIIKNMQAVSSCYCISDTVFRKIIIGNNIVATAGIAVASIAPVGRLRSPGPQVNGHFVFIKKIIGNFILLAVLDGNGRIGRLLITLYLVDKKLLKKPSLYLSDFLEKNRGAYYDALTTVRVSNNIKHWVKFFLTAVIETANKGKDTFEKILKLRAECEQKIIGLGKKAPKARLLLLELYKHPLIRVNQVATMLNVTPQAANALVKDFQRIGILVEITKYKRNRIFVFNDYFNLFLG